MSVCWSFTYYVHTIGVSVRLLSLSLSLSLSLVPLSVCWSFTYNILCSYHGCFRTSALSKSLSLSLSLSLVVYLQYTMFIHGCFRTSTLSLSLSLSLGVIGRVRSVVVTHWWQRVSLLFSIDAIKALQMFYRFWGNCGLFHVTWTAWP